LLDFQTKPVVLERSMELNIQNINFSYENNPVIRELSCRFFPGNFYGIVGPNGSGKTTLLDMISGFMAPDTGGILLEKIDISKLSKRIIAQKIALVSQNYYINFPFSVEEIIMMGRHPYIDRFSHPSSFDAQMVNQVMDFTEISHLKHRKITELSGGEKQRCIFARALCQDTPVLLLDEAFSNMDIKHTLHMLDIVKKAVLETNKIVICVLHDLNLAASWSDEILFLKNGEIKAMGKTEDVMTQDNIELIFDVKSKVEFNEFVQAKQVYFKTI
jgi:iron complex transport system ATP-binding protein